MERIFFIEPSGDGLEPVRSHLSDVARCVRFKSVSDAINSKLEPDFILLVGDSEPHKLKGEIASLKEDTLLSNVPRIVFLPAGTTDFAARFAGIEAEVVLSMPVDRSEVLSRLVKMKKRAQRRVFEILIGIQPEGGSGRFFAKSLDFSRSGVAFECNEQFAEGQKITVTFVNPATKKRFSLEAEIVRSKSTREGVQPAYGARFFKMPEEEHRDLMDFIAGGN